MAEITCSTAKPPAANNRLAAENLRIQALIRSRSLLFSPSHFSKNTCVAPPGLTVAAFAIVFLGLTPPGYCSAAAPRLTGACSPGICNAAATMFQPAQSVSAIGSSIDTSG